MFTEGVKVTIGGKELNLVLNTEAMAQLADKYGDIDGIADKLNNASYSEQIRIVPELIALLASQGEAIRESGEVITPKFITLNTMPRDIQALTSAFLQACAIGLNIKIDAGTEDTDEVLAAIQKNAPGAAGT